MTNSEAFTSDIEIPPDVIEGMVREGQLITVAGSFSVGKSPMLQELAICVATGTPFCGRKVSKRPVVYFDLENAGYSVEQNMRNICDRHGVDYPSIPNELELYIHHGSMRSNFGSTQLGQLLKLREPKDCVLFLAEILSRKPNAFIVIDPVSMFFKIDTIRQVPVLELYGDLRDLLACTPASVLSISFNLRKMDRQAKRANLLTNPRAWMEEVCGSLDLINRADVRIGMDFYEDDDDIRVVNGIRRGESFEPMVLKPVGEPPNLCGFTRCSPTEAALLDSFTLKQKEYWELLPASFTVSEVRDTLVPHSALYRLLKKAESMNLISKSEKVWTKNDGAQVKKMSLLPKGY